MIRNPSIHITKDVLEKLFVELGLDTKKIPMLMFKAHSFSKINRRVINVDSVAKATKIKKVIQVDNSMLGKFALKFRQFILDNKLRKSYPVMTQVHSDWKFIELAVKIYIEFCAEFDLDVEHEMDDFILLSYKVMSNSFSVRKYPYYRTRIIDEYNLLATIQTDPNEDSTLSMFNTYLIEVSKMSTIDIDDLKTNKIYYHFVLGSANAIKKKATMKNWVSAQFESLAYLEAIPEPNQMYGKYAEERYRKWQLKNLKR